MYQHQLTKLIQEFHQRTTGQYRLSRLLNDTDYRNQALQYQAARNDVVMQKLIRTIQKFEDILHHQLQVDFQPDRPKNQTTQSWQLTLFAMICLCFAVSTLAIVEDIKTNRQ